MAEIVALDEADAVFAGDCAFHLDGALDHSVHDVFGDLPLRLVEEEDCFRWLVGQDWVNWEQRG